MAIKEVLVVGGASGIGHAAATLLEQRGYNVSILDVKSPSGDTAKNWTQTVPFDIADRDAVRQYAKRQEMNGSRFHSIIISAGVHSTCPVSELSDEEIDRVMNVNFSAHVKFIRDMLPLVSVGGRIIGISSVGATVGLPMSSIYSASKGALELLYEALHTELKVHGIHPVIIQPGNVNTGFNETGNEYRGGCDPVTDANYEKFVSSIHSRFGISPDTVGQAIVKAVETPIPKLCYVVGGNALKAYIARRILGRSGATFMLRRYLGLDTSKFTGQGRNVRNCRAPGV